MLSGKQKAAALLGRLGGQARAKKLTAAERKAIAKKAAQARWSKHGGKKTKGNL